MPARLAAHMIQASLSVITVSGAAMLLEGGTDITGPSKIGLWITVVASTASIVTALIKWWTEKKKADRDQEYADLEYAREERRRAEHKQEQDEYRAWVIEKLTQNAEKLTQNTDITRETQQINVAALDAANSVNEKIEKIATIAAAKAKSDPMAKDTNETAHRIEDKL